MSAWGRKLGIGPVAIAVAFAAWLVVGVTMASAATPWVRVGVAPQTPAGATSDGALPASTPLQVLIALQPRDPGALAAYATEVSTPGSDVFHHYLTLDEFRADFAPTAAQVASLESALRAQGLDPGTVSANGMLIPVNTTASTAAAAFSTSFKRYQLNGGRVAYANSAAPQFSAAVSPLIQGVIGLNTLTVPHALGVVAPHNIAAHSATATQPHVVTGGPQPCSAAANAAPEQYAYTADQIASAYDFSSLYGGGDEGAGQTVALFELEPNLTNDIAAYQSCYGTDATVNYIKEDGGAGSGAGQGEAALDIEDVVGLAPKATIDVYQAPNSNTGLIENYTAIVDNPAVNVVSTSWGECESEAGSSIINEENTLFEQAATEGQSVYSAAGDDGSTDCGTSSLAVDDPASQPYVTGVGGTTLSTTTFPPSQTVWNDSSERTGAGGGGISIDHTMPSYQSSAPASLDVINANSSRTPCGAPSGSYCREVPDVSADADPYTGFLIYYEGAWTGIGGTSAAAPLWAAFTALTNASSSCAGKAIGFANPKLYTAAAGAYSSDFLDITSGNNDYTPDRYRGGLYAAGAGYDMASGLGTPDGATLPAALCAGSTSGGGTSGGGGNTTNTVTVTNPGAQTTTVGSAVSLQMQGSDSGGDSLTYTATGLPAGLSISSSGLISGTPTTSGTVSVTVTATDATGANGSTTFSWTINAASTAACTDAQLLANPGFESGDVDWSASPDVIVDNSEAAGVEVAQSGSWFAWLGGYSTPHTDTLSQTVTLPASCPAATLSFYKHINTSERNFGPAGDTLTVQLLNSSGTVLTTLATYTNLSAESGYQQVSFSVGRYAGQTVTLKFTGVTTNRGGGTTDFCIDSTALNVS